MKKCPRCSNPFLEYAGDLYGDYVNCPLCGWMKDAEPGEPEKPFRVIQRRPKQKHRIHNINPALYAQGAPAPKLTDYTNLQVARAVYQRWYYYNRRKGEHDG